MNSHSATRGLFKNQYNHLKEGIKYYLIIYVQMGIIICGSQI